jgi:hypothetical protein
MPSPLKPHSFTSSLEPRNAVSTNFEASQYEIVVFPLFYFPEIKIIGILIFFTQREFLIFSVVIIKFTL